MKIKIKRRIHRNQPGPGHFFLSGSVVVYMVWIGRLSRFINWYKNHSKTWNIEKLKWRSKFLRIGWSSLLLIGKHWSSQLTEEPRARWAPLVPARNAAWVHFCHLIPSTDMTQPELHWGCKIHFGWVGVLAWVCWLWFNRHVWVVFSVYWDLKAEKSIFWFKSVWLANTEW